MGQHEMPVDEQAIGQLIGTVSGLSTSFQTMQAAQERNRAEVIDIFKEMRDDVKNLAATTKVASDKLADAMSVHIKEDSISHNDVENIKVWRKEAGDRMDMLWDERNTSKGMFSASRLISGATWSTLAVIAGLLLQWKFK